MPPVSQDTLKNKARRIRLVLLDVDGTLTDGQLIYGPDGEAFKSFNVKDGMGICLAQKEGIKVGLISGRNSRLVEARASELKIAYVWQGVADKVGLLRGILKQCTCVPEDVAFMGDDLNDLPLLKEVGFSAAPGDAVREVREAVDYVTERYGGKGAVRELLDFIRTERIKIG
ncbi:MAG: KdsC family phosphatase [bacterium]